MQIVMVFVKSLPRFRNGMKIVGAVVRGARPCFRVVESIKLQRDTRLKATLRFYLVRERRPH